MMTLIESSRSAKQRRTLKARTSGFARPVARLGGFSISGVNMRYEARWSNGYWKTFDKDLYRDVELHGTQKEAEDNAAQMSLYANRRQKPSNGAPKPAGYNPVA